MLEYFSKRDVGKEIEIIELKTPTYKQSSRARDLLGGLSNTHTEHSQAAALRFSPRFLKKQEKK